MPNYENFIFHQKQRFKGPILTNEGVQTQHKKSQSFAKSRAQYEDERQNKI